MFAAQILHERRLSKNTILIAAVFTALVFLQMLWSSGSGSYVDQLQPTAAVIAFNTVNYLRAFSTFWMAGLDHVWFGEVVRKIFTLLSLGLIAIGYFRSLLSRPSVIEFYIPLYLALIVIWPANQDVRFLIPLFPLAILYLFVGTRWGLQKFQSPVVARAAAAVLVAFPLFLYAAHHALKLPTDEYLVTDAESQEVIDFVLDQTQEDAVLVSARPRILSLMTGRQAAANHEPATDGELFSYLSGIGATHIVLIPPDLWPQDYLREFLARNSDSFAPVLVNEKFSIFARSGT